MKKNKVIKKVIILSSVLMSFSTFAQISDRDKPIEVESISQHIKMKENIVTFTGDVLLTQGSIKLTGDKLTVTKKKIANNEIMISYGKPATFFQIMDDGKPINAKANKIKYDVAKAKITLIGNSEVKQLDSKINGTEIIYYLETEELTVNRAKNTKERVNTIFLPKQFDKKETKKTPIKEK